MLHAPLLTRLAASAVLALPGQVQAQTPPPALPAAQADSMIFASGPFEAQAVAIERTIRCNCGCGLDVHSCLFAMQCGTSPKWATRIRRELRQGETPDAIRAGFVAEFGQTVLMAPPAEGFNLVGYFLPGVAILMTGLLVGMLVRRGPNPIPEGAPGRDFDEADVERVREALKRLDEEQRPDW